MGIGYRKKSGVPTVLMGVGGTIMDGYNGYFFACVEERERVRDLKADLHTAEDEHATHRIITRKLTGGTKKMWYAEDLSGDAGVWLAVGSPQLPRLLDFHPIHINT